MAQPVLTAPIPPQVVNELASYPPFDLKKFIQELGGDVCTLQAELKGAAALPNGMILTSDGILTAIPAKETQGVHEVEVTADSDTAAFSTTFILTIKPALTETETNYLEKLK